MPQMSDDIFLGPVVTGGPLSDGPSPMSSGVGPMGRIYVFDVVPVTLQPAGLALSQNPASGGSFALTAGTGVTTVGGRLTLDVARVVTITAAGANTATYTVFGFDRYGQAMSETLAAPSTSTVTTLKAFKSVTAVTNANATAGTNGLTVGFGDTLGLPYAVTNLGYVVSATFDQVPIVINATNIKVADTTNPATATTGDVRGTVLLGSASDGIKRLVMAILIPGIACGPNATRQGAVGVTQA